MADTTTPDRAAFAGSLWSALTPPGPAANPLDGPEQADLLIVGAGFLGLSTALHLAEAGTRVVLLEAEEAGFGASGRNTGFVVPSLKTSLDPADVERHLGKSFAENLIRLVAASGETVFSLIRRLGIDCSAEETGWFQPAHSATMARTLEQRSHDWRRHGSALTLLSAAETTSRLGLPGYHGALFVPSGGQINPLAYARGLARACVAAGVTLHDGARVTAGAGPPAPPPARFRRDGCCSPPTPWSAGCAPTSPTP